MEKRATKWLERMVPLILTVVLVFSYSVSVYADEKDSETVDGKVRFTVYCQDVNGHTLADAYTFYGNVGEKPAVECPEFAGYQAQAEKITKTLSADEKENVFTFVYHSTVKESAAAETTSAKSDQNVTQEEGAGETISDDNVPLATSGTSQSKSGSEKGDTHMGYQTWKVLDLDTDEPLADPGQPAANVKSGSSMTMVAIAGVVLIAAGLFFILRHNKKKEKQ